MSDKGEAKIGGWIEKSRRETYSNPWISVSHCEVITPAGSDGIYGLVHFKNTAVGVVPIDDEGYTWLVRQSRYPLQEYTWEIPEGGSPAGEETLATAQRELREEVGLEASQWRELQRMHLSNSVSDEAAVLYVARGIRECGGIELDDSEDITSRRLPLSEAVQMVLDGEITDSLSVAALLRLALEQKG
ncbi:NUDIX hydrolase [Halioxenophilus sp. WMMB6]|uniref:NUDIX hydrolase n=1 Tax=Halioxenophilus sp. WMMB6 TaxID=3073815 RepID=UPI00295E4750|nr:NUDIX hydrolase [Halioxenophilus sp. WMMB6]